MVPILTHGHLRRRQAKIKIVTGFRSAEPAFCALAPPAFKKNLILKIEA
jgi:hypothetical protein